MINNTQKSRTDSYPGMLVGTLSLSVVTNLFLYVGQLFIIRTLPREGYASFVVATSFVAMFALIADLGLSPFFTKAFAEANEEKYRGKDDGIGKLLGSYLALRFILSLIVALLTIALSYCFNYSHEQILLMCIFLPSLIISSRLMVFRSTGESLLKSQHLFHKVAIYSAIDAVLFAIIMYFAYLQKSNVYTVMGIYTFSHIPGFILLFATIHKWLQKENIRLKVNKEVIKSTIRVTLPLALGTGFLAIHNNIDSLLLDKLSTPSEVSAYGAGIRLLSALIFIPSIIGGVTAPLVTKAIYNNTSNAILEKVHQLQTLMLAGTTLLAIIITLIPDILISVLFGADRYGDIRNIVILFGWTFIPISFVTFCTELAIAEGKLWMPTIYLSIIVIISVVSDILLIPEYGAFGAAIAKCISVSIGSLTFLVLMNQLKTIQRNYIAKLLGLLAIIVILVEIAIWFITPMFDSSLVTLIVIIPVFAGLLSLFKVIHVSEVKGLVLNLFTKRQV